MEAALEDPSRIGVLLDARQRAAFLPFVGQAATVKQGAEAAGESANTTLARVKRWERLGLLRVVGEVRHARGTACLYRASADAYWVPYRFTPLESLHQLARAAYLPLLEDLLRQYAAMGTHLPGEWGLLFKSRPEGWAITPTQALHCRCSPLADDVPPALLELETLRLTRQRAKQLQRELHDLLAKYRATEDCGHLHAVVLGLTPVSAGA